MIADAIEQAKRMQRKILEDSYDGICFIYEYAKEKDINSAFTESKEVLVYEKVPCHLSFQKVSAAQAAGGTEEIEQVIKLFLAPELDIRAGSKIVVIQNKKTTVYQRSGVAAVYSSHQEVILELWKRRA